MRQWQKILVGAALVMLAVSSRAQAQETLAERVLGKADAPVLVEEFVSFTCGHCAEFTTKILPELEKRYVETGKVRFILRDFPLDGVALKASTLARCMPAEQFYPFANVLFKNQQQWAFAPNSEQILLQYAKLGGLPEDKAKACLQDTKLMDALVAQRTEYARKYDVQATPTFILNHGKERLVGARSVDDFAAAFDRLLAGKK